MFPSITRHDGAKQLCVTFLLAWIVQWAPALGAEKAGADWVLPQKYRLAVNVAAGKSARLNTPCGAAVDFKNVFADASLTGRLDRQSIRVVRYNAGTGKAVAYRDKADHYEVPYTLTGDFFNDDAGIIWWRMQDDAATHFHVYFDALGEGGTKPFARPSVQGLVGIGDMFHYNNGKPAMANVMPLHSTYWPVDWDGDGVFDLIGWAYRVHEYKAPLENWLGNGVFFLKNIGTAKEPLFDSRRRLKDVDGNYLRSDSLPQNMFPDDWDKDGDTDFFGVTNGQLVLWENTGMRDRNNLYLLKPARKLTDFKATSEYRDSIPGVITEKANFSFRGARRVDWEGDGDLDIIATYRANNRLRKTDPKKSVIPYGAGQMIFELFENTGDDDEGLPQFKRPVVIKEERGLPLHAHSVATAAAEYVDWDSDGDMDLLYHDLTNRPLEGGFLMYSENRGSRAKPMFSMPIPILQVWDSPIVVDWNGDGLRDLLAGGEFFENVNPLSKVDPARPVQARTPADSTRPHPWSYPKLVSRGFAQEVDPVIMDYFAISVDWDNDGDLDLVRGHHSNVYLYTNSGTTLDPIFEAGVPIDAGGKPIYMPNWLDPQADEQTHWGPQGPSEPVWGWLCPTMGDFDGDQDLDMFITAQRWQTKYFENVGTREKPRFAAGREIRCEGNPFEFSWRSKVSIGDVDDDKVVELVVTSDRDNVFYAYKPSKTQSDPAALDFMKGTGLMQDDGQPVKGWYGTQNNNGDNHSLLVDWDNDGDLDLINGTIKAVWYYENVGSKSQPTFKPRGKFEVGGEVVHTFNHAGSFDAADWNKDGRLDLVLGTECPSDQPHGAGLHLFDRAFIDNVLPKAELGGLERKEQRQGAAQ